LRRFSQSEKRNSAAEKRGRAKISSPQPPSFLPARAKFFRNQRQDFRGKKFGFYSGDTAPTKINPALAEVPWRDLFPFAFNSLFAHDIF